MFVVEEFPSLVKRPALARGPGTRLHVVSELLEKISERSLDSKTFPRDQGFPMPMHS